MNDEKKSIEITIYGRAYPLKSTASQETRLRSIEESINHQLNEYKLKYQQLDKQDCLSMSLIENKLESMDEMDNLEQSQKALEKLIDIEHLLDQVLV